MGFGHISKNYTNFNLSLEDGIDELYLSRKLDKPSLNWMREFDIDTYLTDDILVKVDRAAMASSLETRAPFLDPRVVHIAQTLGPIGLSQPTQKSILKNVIGKYAPSGQFDRKKQGFGAPLGEWFRTTLKEWGTSIIHETDWNSLEIKSLEIEKLWAELQKSDKSDATFEWLILSLGSSIARAKSL